MVSVLLPILVTYVAGLSIWVISRGLIGDGSLYALSLSYLGIWLFFPLIFFIPWVICNQNKPGALLLAIPTSLLLLFYSPAFLPKVHSTRSSLHTLSVLSFNMQRSNPEVNPFLNLVASHPSEVIALQEVSESSFEILMDALSTRYPYQAAYKPSGLTVFSQYPIVEYKVVYTQSSPFQSLQIKVDKDTIHLINAHLARTGILDFLQYWDMNIIKYSALQRSLQVLRIKDVIDDVGLPAIVTCDANMTDLTQTYAQMTEGLNDSFRELGWGLGHTFLIPRGFEIKSNVNLPFQRIDYIFHTPDMSASNFRLLTAETGSDHRPIWTQFDLSP